LDATSTQGDAAFGSLDPTGLDQIDIVKGPQSGLYGSQAVGGVINLMTLRPTAEPVVRLRGEAGSFGTVASEVQATGPVSSWGGYAIALGGLRTDGFSALTDEIGRPAEHELDGAERSTGTARLEVVPIDRLTTYVAVRGEALNQELDGYLAPDDRVSFNRTRRLRLATGGALDLGVGEVAADVARTGTQRRYYNAYGSNFYRAVDDYGSLRMTGHALKPAHGRQAFDRASMTVGVDTTRAQALTETIDEQTRLTGLWGQVLLGGKIWEFSQTARRDQHSREGDAGTWRTGGAVFVADQDVKIHGSVGTAFRAPSPYELFAPGSTYFGTFYPLGNPDLKPSRSLGADLGHVTRIPGDVTLEQTLFRTMYQQDIVYGNGYENTDGYRVEGLENAVQIRDELPGLRVRVTYTAQRTDLTDEAVSGSTEAPRGFNAMPRHKASIQPSFHQDRWWLAARLDARGRSSGAYASRETAGSAVLSASAGYLPAKGWEVYARGENLGNTAYETYPGNSTSPLAGYGGVSAEF